MRSSRRASLSIEWSLLGFLAEEPMHGYEIHQRLSQAAELGLVWHLKQSRLYALLTRLEKRGYIDYTLEPQESRPPRKVYALTSEGKAALYAWLQSPVDHGRDFRLEFLAKLYFAQREGEAVLRALFEAQRGLCQRWLEQQQMALDALEQGAFEWLVYRFRLGQVQAIVEWLDVSEAALLESNAPIP
jgi:PadR family transcriptional regulator, regulatory protein AphA